MLQLLGGAKNLSAKLAACEGLLRAAIASLGGLAASLDISKEPLDPVSLRLLASEVCYSLL